MSEIPKASIYTKKGDSGQTSLVDGKIVPKFYSRVQAYGDIDELNAVIGLLVQSITRHPMLHNLNPVLFRIQNHLFNIGSLLACEELEILLKLPKLDQTHVDWLEKEIDFYNQPLPVLRQFILPGGHESSAWTHMARTVCRRAERNVAEVVSDSSMQSHYKPLLIYLNRLSDFFFIAGRWVHLKTDSPEVKWDPQA